MGKIRRPFSTYISMDHSLKLQEISDYLGIRYPQIVENAIDMLHNQVIEEEVNGRFNE